MSRPKGHALVSRVAAGLLALAAMAPGLAAQTPAAGTSMVRGRITEAGARPLAEVQVYVPGTNHVTRTDASGTYRLGGLPAGTLQIRAQQIGFGAQTRPVTL